MRDTGHTNQWNRLQCRREEPTPDARRVFLDAEWGRGWEMAVLVTKNQRRPWQWRLGSGRHKVRMRMGCMVWCSSDSPILRDWETTRRAAD